MSTVCFSARCSHRAWCVFPDSSAAQPSRLGTARLGWHFRLQNLPPDEVPSCGPGLDYMLENFPLRDALGMVFKGSGECADVVWSFLGLSMPGWVFVSLVVVGGVGLWNNLTNRRG